MPLAIALVLGCATKAPPVSTAPDEIGEAVPRAPEPAIVTYDETLIVRPHPTFAPDTNHLTPAGQAVADALGDFLNHHPEIRFAVIGIGVPCDVEDYRLGEARARAVVEYLMAQGVAKPRLAYRGHSEVPPCGHRTTFRVEVYFYPPGEAVVTACSDEATEGCYPPRQRLPWNGQMVDVVIPKSGPVPPSDVVVRYGDELALSRQPAFEIDSATLLPEGHAVVEAIASFLEDHAEIAHARIVVEGQCEHDYDVGFELFVARARAITTQLTALGIAPGRLAYANATCTDDGPPTELRIEVAQAYE